jgi:hypothetical protein
MKMAAGLPTIKCHFKGECLVHITNKLSWSKHTKTVIKRARQNLFPLGRLKRFFGSSDPQNVLQLHHRVSWLVAALPGMATARPLQGTTEGSVYGPVHHWGLASCHPGPLYKAVSEEGPKLSDSSHPSHRLLPHSKWYRSAKSRSRRLLNSFYHQAIRLLNS